MYYEVHAEEFSAILRADIPVPSLNLNGKWESDSYSELYSHLPVLALRATLQGTTSSFAISLSLFRDDLMELIDHLQAISSLQSDEFTWSDTSNQIQITITRHPTRPGENIDCDVWLRSSPQIEVAPLEEYHCRFKTTLPWGDSFLSDTRRMRLHSIPVEE